MTKKKIAQPKRRTKRAAEKPVDAEIKRAAERAGIKSGGPVVAERGMVPTTEAELKGFARSLTAEVVEKYRTRVSPRAMAILLLAMSESTAAAANRFRTAFEVEAEKRDREEYLAALSDLVCGGLHVEDDKEGMRPEGAIVHVAAAQLKAIILARHPADSGQAWTMHDDQMSDEDVHVALSGVASMLRNSREVLYGLRKRGEFRSAFERGGSNDDEEQPDVEQAAGGAP